MAAPDTTLFPVASELLGEPCAVPAEVDELVSRLAATTIGSTTNQFADRAPDGSGCRDRLRRYLASRWLNAEVVLVGEAAGYRGALLSGIPFTSVRQLGIGQTSEASATIVHRTLAAVGAEHRVVLWNTVPTHPFAPGSPGVSNRRPTAEEIAVGRQFLGTVCTGRRVVAVGRVAAAALGDTVPCVRHPARGGAAAFSAGIAEILGTPEEDRCSTG